MSHGSDGNKDIQKVQDHEEGDNHNYNKDKDSPSEVDEEKKEDKVDIAAFGNCVIAAKSLPQPLKMRCI